MKSFTLPQLINLIEEHKPNTGQGRPQPNIEGNTMEFQDGVILATLGFIVLLYVALKTSGAM